MKNIVLKVSLIVPIYNEEKYIERFMNSLLSQDFPKDNMEWLFVDGKSKDNTLEILKQYQKKWPDLIRIYTNPNKTVPYAMNIGILNASGEVIIRLDAHSEYYPDYVSKCVFMLQNIDADNVGGIAITKSQNFIGNMIAKMLSSKFGVGNSQFRIHEKSGYVDTVPFGAFHKNIFDRVGLYNEHLTRNQDNELNYRIRKNGGKIYLSKDIIFSYYCRDTIKGLIDMAFKNGKWNIITMKYCPGAMGIRHFVPFFFLLSLICLPLLSLLSITMKYFLVIEVLLYTILDMFFSLKISKTHGEALILFLLFPLFHLTYGFGSFVGLITSLINFK